MKAVGVMTKFARDKRRESNLLANKLRDARQRSRQAEADIVAGVPSIIPSAIAEDESDDAPAGGAGADAGGARKEADAIEMMIEEIGLDQEQDV